MIVLFFLVNWLSYSVYIRFDLSRIGRLRLTSATKEILRKLPEKATIEAFFSAKVPNAYLQQVKQARDFLTEYAGVSRGKVKLVFLDPDANEDAKERANNLKVPQSQISIQGEGDLQLKRIYLAAVLSYADQSEIISDVINVRALEYDLTSRLYRMAYPKERGVAFLSAHGSFGLGNKDQNPYASLDALSETLEKFYGALKPVNTSEAEIPSDVTTLIVAGPTNLSPLDKFRIDQFILRGGNIIFAVSGIQISLENGRGFPTSPDILDFISNYGFNIESNLVLEPKSHIPITRRAPGNPFFVQRIPYPAWIIVDKSNMDQNNLISKGLPGLFLPWTSNIKINTSKLIQDEKTKEKGTMIVLAKSTSDAWSMKDNVFIVPEMLSNALKDAQSKKENKIHNLIVYAKGKFESYFKKNEPPKEAPKNYLTKSKKEAQILSISSPYFLADVPLRQAGQKNLANISLLLSSLDIMNGLEELVDSRGKDVSDPALPSMQPWKIRTWTIANFLLPLLGILLYGFLSYLKRKKISSQTYKA